MDMTPDPIQCGICGAEHDEHDSYCSACGARIVGPPVAGRLPAGALDTSAVWLFEIGLSKRAAGSLAVAGKYLLADVIVLPEGALVSMRNMGPVGFDNLIKTLAGLGSRRDKLRREVEERRGSFLDPSAPAFGASFWSALKAASIDPHDVPIDHLKLSRPTRALFRDAGIWTLGHASRFSGVELVRTLRPRTPDLVMELGHAGARFLERYTPHIVEESLEPVGEPEVSELNGYRALVSALEALNERQRQVLSLRFGLEDQPAMTLANVGEQLVLTRERIRQIEVKALTLLSIRFRSFEPAFRALDEMRQVVGLHWRDRRLPGALNELACDNVRPYLKFRPLLVEVFVARDDLTGEIGAFDAAVVAILAGSDPLPLEELAIQVTAMLDPTELESHPGFSASRRIEIIGPAAPNAEGRYELPPTPVGGVQDKRLRRLQTIRRVLERDGPSHFAHVSRAMNELLPERYHLAPRNVRTWLERYHGIFVWAGKGAYGLKAQEFGIRAEQLKTATDGRYQARTSRRKGIGDEIAAFLADFGPSSLDAIEEHILARFAVKQASILAAIKADRTRRFVLNTDQTISLRGSEREAETAAKGGGNSEQLDSAG